MKRLKAIVFILFFGFILICFFQARSCYRSPSESADFSTSRVPDLKKIDSKLSAVHSKSLNRENEDDVRNFRKWLEVVDRTEKVSRTEIDEVKRAFAGVDKAGSAPVGARILVFDGETPTTTDVLLLLSRQCNYTKCPNVCVEDEEYFYAWREGDFRHGTLVDRKNLSVRTWSFRDGACVLYW